VVGANPAQVIDQGRDNLVTLPAWNDVSASRSVCGRRVYRVDRYAEVGSTVDAEAIAEQRGRRCSAIDAVSYPALAVHVHGTTGPRAASLPLLRSGPEATQKSRERVVASYYTVLSSSRPGGERPSRVGPLFSCYYILMKSEDPTSRSYLLKLLGIRSF
jgi:hypothetical protein